MVDQCKSVFVIAPPGRWRDSLLVLLQASGQVALAGQADDGPAGLQWLADHTPTNVLLDADLPEPQVWWTLHQFRSEWPQLHCLVLVHTHAQECQARANGADVVVQAGLSAEALFNALAALIAIRT